ncbi:unnamed protein product [Bemisia tabaci]|uniref:Phosphatidylinositol N-acetylglucosaminyltransferase subunit Q n=1 Tax=Bemisia tabaci TaxID=7038 RepID=A0A9P0A8N9_BEMTA|nr:unnamed protein product [Bemisia tabaci]
MTKLAIIFLPCDLYQARNGFLYGIVQTLAEGSTVFYVLGHNEERSPLKSKTGLKYLGSFGPDNNGELKFSSERHWLQVQLLNQELLIHHAIGHNRNLLSDCSSVISIIYDPQAFLTSELLECSASPSKITGKIEDVEHLKILTSLLQDLKHDTIRNSSVENFPRSTLLQCLSYTLRLLKPVLCISQKLFPVLKIFWICCRFICFLENVIWCISTYVTEKKLTLKAGNYIFGRVLDSILGILTLYYLMENFTNDELFQLMANLSEDIVMKLRIIIHWLMGSPAGLKLNAPLTNLLGQFYLYHVNLWWSFLVVTRPGLEIIYAAFLRIGLLGLSFQISILSDLLMFTSFHIYCIYVYAARLFNLQLTFLFYLLRVMIGRKRNPEPGQVDSDPYTTETLFLGTLAFTILLFLLPTTFVYYLMFAILRMILVAVGGLLARINLLLQTLPVFVTFQWFFNSSRMANSFDLRPKSINSHSNHVVLSIAPVTTSLWSIIKSSIPDAVKFPRQVDWPHIIRSLAFGRLIYTI